MQRDSSVSVIAAATNTVVATVPWSWTMGPCGVAITPDGRLRLRGRSRTLTPSR